MLNLRFPMKPDQKSALPTKLNQSRELTVLAMPESVSRLYAAR